MSNVIVAYIPVLHEGYRTFFENHKDADTLYLFGKEFISEHYYLEKDLRALTPELIKTAIESWNFFKNIDILTKENIALLNNKEIIMPDEDISHDFKDNYLTDTNVTFDPMFLRWEKINLRREKKVGVEITMTENEFMNSAFLESKKSSDWWRQVGAVLVKEGKILLSKSNQHVPSSQQPYVDGDPRCLSVKGQDLDLYTSLHAEAGIIAGQYNNIMDKLEQSENQKNIWKNRVSKEIQLAIDVQQRLMPKRTIMNFPIHGINVPAREISGDFYDFYVHNDEVYFTLCDVSGKGVNAGMVMARAITLFKIYSKNKFKPNEIHFEMNNDLQQTNPKGVYVTSIIGCYNSKTDIVELSNAGHLPALFRINDNFTEYNSSSLPLGVKKADNSNEYKLESFKLEEGRLYCFTDGYSECRNDQGEEIGIEGVKKLILENNNSSLKKEITKISKFVEQSSTKGVNFNTDTSSDNILEDDLTIVGLGK